MSQAVNSRILWATLLFAISLLSIPADAKYSGGSGTAAEPYQIATAVSKIYSRGDAEALRRQDRIHFILCVPASLREV